MVNFKQRILLTLRNNMGAEGYILICKKEDFENANPGISPRWLDLYSGNILGTDCVWGYCGDNLLDYFWHKTPVYGDPNKDSDRYKVFDEKANTLRTLDKNERENLERAIRWFSDNSESHELWT